MTEVTHINWAMEVAQWWNSIINNKSYKHKQLYLYGPSNTGKSTLIESIIGRSNMPFVFLPGVGKFAFGDFDSAFHKVILFEEFEWQYHCKNMLKRLLEGRCFSAPVKCCSDKLIKFNGPVIIVTNDENEVSDLAFVNRLQFVYAADAYYTAPTAPVPKDEPSSDEEACMAETGQEIVEISSDEEC